uniref:Uncharacterized protein n=1 Tax=Anguilla anguilla TaxID=7936 RepID=A0A0E9WZL5_ANGAN
MKRFVTPLTVHTVQPIFPSWGSIHKRLPEEQHKDIKGYCDSWRLQKTIYNVHLYI